MHNRTGDIKQMGRFALVIVGSQNKDDKDGFCSGYLFRECPFSPESLNSVFYEPSAFVLDICDGDTLWFG